MQFALEKCLLAPYENEIRLFASTYRRTEGQVKFLVGNGLLKRSFLEMTSIVVGFNSWALNRFRTSSVASLDTSEYYDFEDWLDNTFGNGCPAGARLVEMREAYCLSTLNHDTMRAALFEYMTTGHAHLLEHACANNGDKYRSILEAWRVVLETCPAWSGGWVLLQPLRQGQQAQVPVPPAELQLQQLGYSPPLHCPLFLPPPRCLSSRRHCRHCRRCRRRRRRRPPHSPSRSCCCPRPRPFRCRCL